MLPQIPILQNLFRRDAPDIVRREAYEKLFDVSDRDNNGDLSQQELFDTFRSMDVLVSHTDICDMMCEFKVDESRDGLCKEEFVLLLLKYLDPNHKCGARPSS